MKWVTATLLSVGCLQKALCMEEAIEPLYAGTLLSYYATNADPGKMSIQPYLYSIRGYGLYQNDWDLKRTKNLYQNQLLLSFETGITKFLDVTLDLNGFYNSFESKQTVAYGDTQIYFGL